MASDFLGEAKPEQQGEVIAHFVQQIKADIQAITKNKDAPATFKKNLEELRKKNQAKAKEAQKAQEKVK